MKTTEELLRMDHLTFDKAEALSEGKVPEPEGPNPRHQPEYTFTIDVRTERGAHFAGSFTNRILTIDEARVVAILAANLQGGADLDPFMVGVCRALAHLSKSLIAKPKWAEKLAGLSDLTVVETIWKEVQAHEAAYFRLESPPPIRSEKE